MKKYKIIYENLDKNDNLLNIENLRWKKIKQQNKLNLNIDFNLFSKKNYKKIIKNFDKLKTNFVKKFKENSCINIYVHNYNSKNSSHLDFLNAIKAIMFDNIKDKYSYIYDVVCNYLDYEFTSRNLCDFQDNKCGEKLNTNSEIGCCRHYKNKLIGPLAIKNNWVTCEYLKNKHCSVKCISCKLYTCDYLRKKGIQFRIKNIFLLDTFFNLIQKYIIKISVFTPKEKILKRLLLFSL